MNVFSSSSRLQTLMCRGAIITASAVLVLFGAGLTFVMAAGPQPNIQRITPNVTSSGGPEFTLVVNGSGFVASSVVQWNGARRPSYFDSATQELKAAIPASDIAAAGVARITVVNPDGRLSAPTTLVITSRASDRIKPKFFVVPILGPVLNSVSPGVVAQGARQVRLTLVGANFRPGARVVISAAAGIRIDTITRISSELITAVITIGDHAAEGIRSVDVFNTDGTNTGPVGGAEGTSIPGSSKPLRITSNSSLGAPLGVQTMVITYPRSGTVLSRGDRVFASAILGGTGTGTITGQWVLDGNVIEQFAVPMTGGERVLLKSTQSLPTFNLGLHTLELRVTGPNLLASRPVEIVVNPGEWKLMRLIAPRSDAGFTPDSPPLLRWDIVPGAAAYQVGFSSKPFFNSVDEWHDVNDTQWRVPSAIWTRLPEGELYWTVRVVETSGQTREPSSMRRIRRLPTGILETPRAAPTRTSGGATLLEWKGLGKDVVYRVTVSRDLNGRDIVRKFFVPEPHLDLHSIAASFQPGLTYYWLVEAYSTKGGLIIAGDRHSFTVDSKPATPKLARVRYEQDSRGASNVTSNDKIAGRTPAPNEKVADARPLVRVEFKTGAFASELVLAVDGTDVTALAEAAEPSINYKPVIPLKNGEHEITITIGAESESWRFVVEQSEESLTTTNATAAGTQAETEQPPATEQAAGAAASGGGEKPAAAGAFTMEAGLNTQLVSGSENETNTLSLAVKEAQQHGVWKVEVNGTGTLNSVVGPSQRRQSLSKFSDYIIHMAGAGKLWGSDSRFGLMSPTVFNGSEFITTAFSRPGIESTLRTPAGTVGFFHNTNDLAPGGGKGAEFHQAIRGVTYTAPLPKERAVLQLMRLDAQDVGMQVAGLPATPGAGDAEGALLALHLPKAWVWTSEYAIAHNNLDTLLPSSRELFGRAWRSAIAGALDKTALTLSYRDVSSDYGTPINPSLSQGGNGNRRGLDVSAARPTSIGNFTLTYNFLQSDVRRSDRPAASMHNVSWNWAKSVTATTDITIGGLDTHTQTGKFSPASPSVALEVDKSQIGFNTSVTQRIGAMTLAVTGKRDWSRDQVTDKQNVITSAINVSANGKVKSFFQLESNISSNWTAGEPFSAGATRMVTSYIQPMFTWQRTSLSITPLLAITKTTTRLGVNQLTADTLTRNSGVRLSWKMPGQFKFSTLGVDGGWMRSRNGLLRTDETKPRLLVLWTLLGGKK